MSYNSGSTVLKGSALQQSSTFGTWTEVPAVNQFILPVAMQNHLVKISRNNGVVYKTK